MEEEIEKLKKEVAYVKLMLQEIQDSSADNDIVNPTTVMSGDIKSGNFVAGSTGWQITSAGDSEFNSLVVSGFIETEGAAADINTYSTTIGGGKITTNSIAADKLSVSTLSAISADMGTITAGTITGATLQTASSGRRIAMSSAVNNKISFYNESDTLIGDLIVTGSASEGELNLLLVDGAGLTMGYGTGVSSSNFFSLGSGGGGWSSAGTSGVSFNGVYRTSSSSEYLAVKRGSGVTTAETDLTFVAPAINLNGTTRTTWPSASMVYPGAGIALSTGSAWGTSITNNSSNWNTAYGWGDHASGGYAVKSSSNTFTSTNIFSGLVTANGGITLGASDVLTFSAGAYIDDPKAIYFSLETSAPGASEGGVYYNTSTGYLYVHDGSGYKALAYV
jgi:hypothetical protein